MIINLEDFRKGKSKTFEFNITFEKIGKLTSKIIDIFESNLMIITSSKSFGFSNLLEEVFDICNTTLQEPEFHDVNLEVKFKNSTEEI